MKILFAFGVCLTLTTATANAGVPSIKTPGDGIGLALSRPVLTDPGSGLGHDDLGISIRINGSISGSGIATPGEREDCVCRLAADVPGFSAPAWGDRVATLRLTRPGPLDRRQLVILGASQD